MMTELLEEIKKWGWDNRMSNKINPKTSNVKMDPKTRINVIFFDIIPRMSRTNYAVSTAFIILLELRAYQLVLRFGGRQKEIESVFKIFRDDVWVPWYKHKHKRNHKRNIFEKEYGKHVEKMKTEISVESLETKKIILQQIDSFLSLAGTKGINPRCFMVAIRTIVPIIRESVMI